MFFLALRHLTSRKKQTVLTLLGILLGTAAYVSISGMMTGFQLFIINQLVNNDAHIRISAKEELITEHSLDQNFFLDNEVVDWKVPPSGRRDSQSIEYPQGWFDRLSLDDKVLAFSPQFSTQMIFSRGKVSVPVKLIGSNPEKQVQVSNIEEYMLVGKFRDIGFSGNKLVIGDGLLKKLGSKVSESILVSSGSGLVTPFKIVGIFHLGIKTLDDSTAFAALGDVQKAKQSPSSISDIAIRLKDVSKAKEIAMQWSGLFRDKIQSWDQANEGIMSVFTTQNIVRNSMTISILVVAGFGIYNILSISVATRRREIAILRSMGFESQEIEKLFLIQGLILGFIGGLLGTILGYILCSIMATIEVSADRGIGGNKMMINFDPIIFITAFVLAVIASALASYWPSRSAGKLSPIDIIRTEGA